MKKIITLLLILFLSVVLINNSYSEPRKVLLEYCTGTWCGWCPCGHQALNTILATYPQTVAIAYHGASNDPWQNFNGSSVRSLLGFNAYPTAIIDRGNTPSNPYVTYDQWYGRVQNRYTSSPNTNINMVISSKSYVASTRELSVTVNSTAIQNLSGNYKISLVLVENNLIYQQNHYTQCGGNGYVQNYVHAHNCRSMLNGPTGENLNTGGIWNQNQMLSKSVVTVLDASWVPENCHVIAFAYRDSSVLALANVEQALTDDVITGIISNNSEVPKDYYLSQNFPNPFNPVTHVKFSLPADTKVKFKIYDVLGNEVETYIDDFLTRGTYNVEIDGSKLSSGVYFYKLSTDKFTDMKKMILIK